MRRARHAGAGKMRSDSIYQGRLSTWRRKLGNREAALDEREQSLREREKRMRDSEAFIGQLREANQQLITSKLEMSHLAHHDFLTDLPNRLQFEDHLRTAISLAARKSRALAVLFLDLDRFKRINDTLGHAIGDQLLQAVAQRLRSCVRASDTVSRQGGDEFVILLSEIERLDDAAYIAEKIVNALAQPFHFGEQVVYVGASVGIAVHPADGASADDLVKHADTAMYHAKARGRGQYQFFKPEMNRRAQERRLIEDNLRDALSRHQLVLHFQPKIDLRTCRVRGLEALVRWPQADGGMAWPAQFIPAAEESGLIVQLGEWVLGEACRQARHWLDLGLDFGRVAVNLSPLEFRHGDLLARVMAALADSGLPAHCLELELTENVLVDDSEAAAGMLMRLRKRGVHVAVDDFGTGFSSLSYLKHLPVDTLKIDQSFIRDVNIDAADASIVTAVIYIGGALHQQVVAEGVETAGQYAFLRAHDCELGQGYFFCPPLPADEIGRLLQQWDPAGRLARLGDGLAH